MCRQGRTRGMELTTRIVPLTMLSQMPKESGKLGMAHAAPKRGITSYTKVAIAAALKDRLSILCIAAFDTGTSSDELISAVRSTASRGVTLLLVYPDDERATLERLSHAKRESTHVIVVASDISRLSSRFQALLASAAIDSATSACKVVLVTSTPQANLSMVEHDVFRAVDMVIHSRPHDKVSVLGSPVRDSAVSL